MRFKRRALLQLLAAAAAPGALASEARLGPRGPVLAGVVALSEGADYELVSQPPPLPAPGETVRVSEFFNYSCPACNSWLPSVETWIEGKPDYVEWERTPLAFTRYNGLFARTHFVLEAFDREDLVDEVFHAIHTERKVLNSEGRIAEWLAEEHGLDEEAVEKAFDSFTVNTKMRRAARRAEALGIQATPTFVVADRYLLSPGVAGGPERLFPTMDELVESIHAGDPPR